MKAVLRRIMAAKAVLILLCIVSVITVSASEKSREIVVFAAASLTESLEQIAQIYQASNPETVIIFNFDSSGTLKTQIKEGAECDIFISAAPKQMNALDAAVSAEGGNEKGLDFIISESRINLLENKVALAVPEGNPAGIKSFEDLIERLKKAGDSSEGVFLAIGNSDVPVGQYAMKIFKHFDLKEERLAAAGLITYGTNVKEITTQISEALVDCGIIYSTDAFSAGIEVVDTATEEMCGQVIYPAAVLKVSSHEEEAKAFLEYLQTEEAGKVFESIGFTQIKQENN